MCGIFPYPGVDWLEYEKREDLRQGCLPFIAKNLGIQTGYFTSSTAGFQHRVGFDTVIGAQFQYTRDTEITKRLDAKRLDAETNKPKLQYLGYEDDMVLGECFLRTRDADILHSHCISSRTGEEVAKWSGQGKIVHARGSNASDSRTIYSASRLEGQRPFTG